MILGQRILAAMNQCPLKLLLLAATSISFADPSSPSFASCHVCVSSEHLRRVFRVLPSVFPARQGPKSPEKGFCPLKFRKWEVARGAGEPSDNKTSCPADTAADD